jgi:curved DNA-binding protein CbpA
MRAVKDYYSILDLSPGASNAVIKARYRELSMAHHPDRGGDEVFMAAINEAYGVLSDPLKRASHDAALRRSITQQPITRARPQPAPQPRPQPQPTAASTDNAAPNKPRRSSWWAKLIWGTSLVAVAIGFLFFLPIAQASRPEPNATQPTSAPLAADPPATPPSHVSITSTAPSESSSALEQEPTPETPQKTPDMRSADPCLANTCESPKEACTFKQRIRCSLTHQGSCTDKHTGSCSAKGNN